MEANYFTILYWFCQTSTWICHGYTWVPHPETPPTSFPIPSLWVIPVHQPCALCVMHWTWTGDSFHIWYYTCFNAIIQITPPLPSPTESKRLFYTSVSLCCLTYRVIITIFLNSIYMVIYVYIYVCIYIYVLVYCIGVFLSGLLHSV